MASGRWWRSMHRGAAASGLPKSLGTQDPAPDERYRISRRRLSRCGPNRPARHGVDVDYPGYDGIHLPFPDESQDAVYNSHCLEHIANYHDALLEWYRVLKIGGYLIIVVPHQHMF